MQMVQSGDIHQFVTTDEARQVVYLSFYGQDQLRKTTQELEERIETLERLFNHPNS